MTEWIFPCDLDQYDLYKVFEDKSCIEWRAHTNNIQNGDICYIYVSRTEKAIRFKCQAISDIKDKTSIDDSAYGGKEDEEEFRCITLKLIGGYTYPGICLKELRKHGLKSSLQDQQRVEGKLLDYTHDVPLKVFSRFTHQNQNSIEFTVDEDLFDSCAEMLQEKAIVALIKDGAKTEKVSFSTGLFRKQEWYKRELFEKAQKLLDIESWEKESIGKGEIKNHVLAAMKMKSSGEPQNLIDWRDVDSFEKRLNEKLNESESILFDLYKSEDTHKNNRQVFLRAVRTWGGKYTVISFLYFIKDRNRYAVVRARDFKKRLEMLGIRTGCLDTCSWDNYRIFNTIMEFVRARIEPYFGKAELIDAHSFVWMMWMLNDNPKGIEPEEEQEQKLIKEVGMLTSAKIPADFQFKGEVKAKDKPQIIKGRKVYPRDRQTAINALAHAHYICEIDEDHPVFIRRNSDKGYTEPHHLVPMAFSDRFEVSLDVEENIVSLCSNCHNQIHYGKGADKLLKKLYKSRKKDLENAGIKIDIDELLEMYGLQRT